MQAIPHVYRSQEERDQNKGLSFASVHKYLKHQKPSFPVAKNLQKILLDLFRSLENVNAPRKLTEDRKTRLKTPLKIPERGWTIQTKK